MEDLLTKAQCEGREMTDGEESRFETLKRRCDDIDAQLKVDELQMRRNLVTSAVDDINADTLQEHIDRGGDFGSWPGRGSAGDNGPELWKDQKGRIIKALRPQDRLANNMNLQLPSGASAGDLKGSFGRWLRAKVTGDWRGAEVEHQIMAAGGTGDNTAGGYLVPDPMFAQVIDIARANSVVINAGARTIPMDAADLRIARVSADPTPEFKGENDAFTNSGPAFDSVKLVSHTFGIFATFSRELMADGVNAAQLLEETFAKALAAKWDYYLLTGDATSGSITGIINSTGLNTVTSVGSPTWDDFLEALKLVEEDKGVAGAYIFSPGTAYSLRTLKVNSEANHYATRPPDIAALRQFVTTSMADTHAVLGDFTQALVGVRQNIQIEATTEAGDTFKKHQVGIKAVLRGDVALAHSDHFTVLSGIS